MTRAISIGRGSVGQPRTPRRLPSSGAGLVGQAIASEAARVGSQVTNIAGGVVAGIQQERRDLADAQTKSQLGVFSARLEGIARKGQEKIANAPSESFRSDEERQAFVEEVRRETEAEIQEASQGSFSSDANQAIQSNLPSFREQLSNDFDSLSVSRMRQVLRSDAGFAGQRRQQETLTMDQAKSLGSELRARVFTPDLFTDAEREAFTTEQEIKAFENVIADGYFIDPLEGAARALEIPTDRPELREFAREQLFGAKRALEQDYNPSSGYYGFETLKTDVSFTEEEQIRVGNNLELIEETFDTKVSLLETKRLEFLQNRGVIERVLGEKAAKAIEDNFTVMKSKLGETQATLEVSRGIVEGNLVGAGPNDPTTIAAGKLAAPLLIQALEEEQDDVEYAKKFADQIQSLAHVPAEHMNKLVGDFSDPRDPRRQARAAFTFGELYEQSDFFAMGPGGSVVPDDQALQMIMVHNQIKRLKIPAAQAVNNVLERTKEIDLVDRGRVFEESHQGTQGEAIVGFTDTLVPFEETAGLPVPVDMQADFDELTKLFFQQSNGEIETARKYAWSQLQLSWGVTRDAGGDPRWSHRPPELEFQGRGDPSWQNSQFRQDWETAVGGNFSRADVRFVPVDNPNDPTGKPVYMVMQLRGGVPEFVETKKSTPGRPDLFIWAPDFKTSPKAVALRTEETKARRTRTIDVTTVPLTQLRRNVQKAIGVVGEQPRNNSEARFLGKAQDTLALIDRTLAASKDKAVTASEFEAMVRGLPDRLPLSDQELERRGIFWTPWKDQALDELNKSKQDTPGSSGSGASFFDLLRIGGTVPIPGSVAQ